MPEWLATFCESNWVGFLLILLAMSAYLINHQINADKGKYRKDMRSVYKDIELVKNEEAIYGRFGARINWVISIMLCVGMFAIWFAC